MGLLGQLLYAVRAEGRCELEVSRWFVATGGIIVVGDVFYGRKDV